MFEIQVFVPVSDNDGVAFDAGSFEALEAVLCDRFGGFTLFPSPVVGGWRGPEGRIYRDTLRVYGVWTEAPEVSDAIRVTADYVKTAFRQEAVSVRVPATGRAEIV